VSHANAQLTPAGRLRLAQLIVDRRWTLRRAAERWNCSVTTAKRWADRYRKYGADGMRDRSSRPKRSPRQTPTRRERRVIGLRVSRRWGPARIAYLLRMPISTAHKILTRYRCPRLTWTDPATGTRIRGAHMSRRPTNAYLHDAPGDLIHVDIKKLGLIPPGGGWRFGGRGSTQDRRSRALRDHAARGGAPGSRGYAFIHHAIDDHSRLAYSEIHTNERKETAVGFIQRARAFFASHGITVRAVLTDNGSCYRSNLWAKTLTAAGIKHRRTRPYRPQTNGKVERFNRTLLEEFAYAREYHSEADRQAAYPDWIHTYNHHRPHTALGGKSPADVVTNLRGQNS
jgi:transposase InsO family protein